MAASWAVAQLALCDRFKCLPSALAAEDMELMRMLEIESMVKGVGDGGE